MKLIGIQYLRAIAVLMVVWTHARHQFPAFESLLPFDHGANGVDLFFVISGFIMVHTTHGKSLTPRQFMVKRLTRIVPLYWLATLLIAAVALVMPSALKSTVLQGDHLLASLAFLAWPSPSMPGEYWPVLIPGWSINLEMYFYLLFSATLLLKQAWRVPALAVLIGTASVALPHDRATPLSFYADPIVFEFVAGALLGELVSRGQGIRQRSIAWATVAAGVLYWMAANELGAPSRLVGAGVAATLLVWGVCHLEIRAPSGLNWLLKVGNASYSVYLTHVFTLAILRTVWNKTPALPKEGPLGAWLFVLTGLTASAVVGYVAYRWVEDPLTARLNRWIKT